MTSTNWLGTDQYGRDIMSMIMVGARYSLGIALLSIFFGSIIGITLGMVIFLNRNIKGDLILGISNILFAFPALVTAIILTAVQGPHWINVVIAVILFNIPIFTKLTYSIALAIESNLYIQAAKALGRNNMDNFYYHILPNIKGILIVQMASQFSLALLAEAGLSYLGFGVQPPDPSWGRMLSEAQSFIMVVPELSIYPGMSILITVLAGNLIGHGLRNALDPKYRYSIFI
ncbi:MAG: ABC transporter permease [Alphaproteobacteria bacterium]|nr:ABC transporter permease [Alphaproteobacteria bacterium]